MKVSATELASDSKAILDRVIDRGEAVDIQWHGKTVAELRPKVSVSREELARNCWSPCANWNRFA